MSLLTSPCQIIYPRSWQNSNTHHPASHSMHHMYGQPEFMDKAQYTTSDNFPLLEKYATTQFQAISSTFLYYARVIDPTILPSLNQSSNQQSKPTKKTAKACKRLMEYLITTPKSYHWEFLRYCIVCLIVRAYCENMAAWCPAYAVSGPAFAAEYISMPKNIPILTKFRYIEVGAHWCNCGRCMYTISITNTTCLDDFCARQGWIR